MSDKRVTIPDKRYFKIGEVSEITNVEPHVLRYWESEFKIIRPQRASSKQRLYRRVDVENILRIRRLLYEEGFTIAGAKKALTRKKQANDQEEAACPAAERAEGDPLLRTIKSELAALKKLLEE